MKVSIRKSVFTKINPELEIVLLSVKGADNSTKLKQSKLLLRDIEELIQLTFNKESVVSHGLISPWEAARQHLKGNVKHYHTSVERLIHELLRRKLIVSQDVLTNLVRFISLKYLVPIGLDDSEKLQGNISFALATGNEKLGIIHAVKKGALLYKDQESQQPVLGTKLDFWKNRRTAATAKSKDILIHLMFLPPVSKAERKNICDELTSLVETFTGAKVRKSILNAKNVSQEL